MGIPTIFEKKTLESLGIPCCSLVDLEGGDDGFPSASGDTAILALGADTGSVYLYWFPSLRLAKLLSGIADSQVQGNQGSQAQDRCSDDFLFLVFCLFVYYRTITMTYFVSFSSLSLIFVSKKN